MKNPAHTIFMPGPYTHFFVAKEAERTLSSPLREVIAQNPALYFFGSQGADFCFFQPSLRRKKENLGSFLHREGGFSSLHVLKFFSHHNEKALAYALGYVSHYATDSTFHPYVYAMTGDSALRHTRLEHVLDARFKKRFSPEKEETSFIQKLNLEEKELLFFLYTSIAVKSGFPAPKKSTFYRAIFLFNAYLSFPNNLFDGANANVRSFIANEEKRTWTYPALEKLQSTDSVDELFTKSVLLTQSLNEHFFQAVKTGAPLPKSLFGKGFLTGI